MDNPTDQEKRELHIQTLKKMTTWAGWILAFSSLAIGTFILNKMHLELLELRQENKELQISLKQAEERSTHRKDPAPLSQPE